MNKFRKRPVVIEAFQMTCERRANFTDWPSWLKDAVLRGPDGTPGSVGMTAHPHDPLREVDKLLISTLEGVLLVDWDDWIIQGVKGELYPCKPDIFALTYEAVIE